MQIHIVLIDGVVKKAFADKDKAIAWAENAYGCKQDSICIDDITFQSCDLEYGWKDI